MGALQNTWLKGVLLALLALVMTIVQANFVGDITIYSLNSANERETSHEDIIHNQAPAGGWDAKGENGVNIRIAIPYLVEFLHRTTNARVLQLYKGVDLVFLWLGFLILFFYLRRWFVPAESLFALVYFAAISPLTFAFHSYQPWDRASLVGWLLGFWAARDERFWTFFAIAIAAFIIKYDAIMLPALYFLAHVNRQNWRKIVLQSLVAGATLLAIFVALRILLPGGFEPRDLPATVLRNIKLIAGNPLFYAPSLAFALPLVLAALGYASADRFIRACLWFAGLVAMAMFVTTNFEEVRAEQMLFPLLAPAALLGLRRVMSDRHQGSPSQPRPVDVRLSDP
jgi:hypothetical protein